MFRAFSRFKKFFSFILIFFIFLFNSYIIELLWAAQIFMIFSTSKSVESTKYLIKILSKIVLIFKVNKEPFDVYIKKLLRREVSQPITKIGSRSMSLSESIEVSLNINAERYK